jgi:hypothetical protein
VLDMTGSNAVLIVVPIVMLPALALWLGLVMYAGSHPEWKVHRLAREALAREVQVREVQAPEVMAREVQDRQAAGGPAGTQRPVTPRVA